MNPMDVDIITVTAGANSRLEAVPSLFREYEQFLSIDLSFQEFEKELARLPGKYTAPNGVLLLALVGEETAGCAAFRKHEKGICEMKRLYVKPISGAGGSENALRARFSTGHGKPVTPKWFWTHFRCFKRPNVCTGSWDLSNARPIMMIHCPTSPTGNWTFKGIRKMERKRTFSRDDPGKNRRNAAAFPGSSYWVQVVVSGYLDSLSRRSFGTRLKNGDFLKAFWIRL